MFMVWYKSICEEKNISKRKLQKQLGNKIKKDYVVLPFKVYFQSWKCVYKPNYEQT